MRQQFGIEGNRCNDCIISWCCPCCALVQEDQEVKARGGVGVDSKAYDTQPDMIYAPP